MNVQELMLKEEQRHSLRLEVRAQIQQTLLDVWSFRGIAVVQPQWKAFWRAADAYSAAYAAAVGAGDDLSEEQCGHLEETGAEFDGVCAAAVQFANEQLAQLSGRMTACLQRALLAGAACTRLIA